MQVLVDTSVWIDFLSEKEPKMKKLLLESRVVIHPFIIGEIACGSLKNRDEIVGLLNSLPQVSVSQHSEVLYMLERHKLFGKGVGWVDLHLLSSALMANIPLMTKDKKLLSLSKACHVAYAD